MKQRITILAHKRGYRVERDSLTGRLYYNYCANYAWFRFSLFSEIGAPYQPWFKNKLSELGITPVAIETERDYFEIDSTFIKQPTTL